MPGAPNQPACPCCIPHCLAQRSPVDLISYVVPHSRTPNYFSDCDELTASQFQVGKLDIKFFLNIRSYLDGTCDRNIDIQYGMMRLEAFYYALDTANSNALLLHGHSLGAYVYDSCKNPNKAVICSIGQSESIIAMIGPESSNAINIGSMVYSSFTPQTAVIAYGGTGEMLQDKEQYPNLFQTVPSGAVMVDALTDIAVLYNWTFVAVLYSPSSNMGSDIREFRSAASRKGICIKYSAPTKKAINDKFFEDFLKPLKKQAIIQVVYLLLTDADARALFVYLSKHQADFANLQFIGGQHLGTKLAILSGNEMVDLGLITIELESPQVPGFKDYFLSLRPESNSRNAFFAQFWEQVFNCSLAKNGTGTMRRCLGNESLTEGKGYYENVPVLPVIDAVLAISYALSEALNERCSHLTGAYRATCLSSMNVTKIDYNDIYLQDTMIASLPSIRFTFPLGRHFQFDSQRRQILNYTIYCTKKLDNKVTFVKTGTWRHNSTYSDPRFQYKDRLFINSSLIQWRTNSTPVSRCGIECGENEIRVYDRTYSCCWTCKSCQQNSIVLNNTCKVCSEWTRSNTVAKICVPMPIEVINMSSALPVVIILLAAIYIVIVFAILFIYIWRFTSRSIKSTSRELSLVSLFGLLLTFFTPLSFLARPSILVCSVQQCLLGMSLTLCCVPLFLKTFVIYRILKKASISAVAPKLSKKRSQIFICAGLITIQALLCALWIQGNPGTVKRYTSADNTHIITHCKYDLVSLIINFAYPCFIMVLALVFAFRTKTKNLPIILSEGKRVVFASALNCLIIFLYLVTFTVYFNAMNSFIQEYSISFVYIIIGAINISFIFLPRVFFVLRPSPTVFQSQFQSPIHNAEEQNTINFSTIQIVDRRQSKEPQAIQTKCSHCNNMTDVVLRSRISKTD